MFAVLAYMLALVVGFIALETNEARAVWCLCLFFKAVFGIGRRSGGRLTLNLPPRAATGPAPKR